MEERIIVIPYRCDIAKTLAYHNKSLFNVRFMSPVELASEALIRTGKLIDKACISRNEELMYYSLAMDGVDYFKTKKLADIKNINQTINTLRQLSFDDDQLLTSKLNEGLFLEKNKALLSVYHKYLTLLNQDNKLDTIGLIKYVFDNVKDLKLDIEVIKELPIDNLDKKLVEVLCKEFKEISLFDLYDLNTEDIHIESYANTYGASNEVNYILDKTSQNKETDKTIIATGDYNTYSQIFYDYVTKYDLKITFGGGLSIINSYPGKLLQQYYHWSNAGNFGWEPFNSLIYSPYFNFELLDSLIDENINRVKFLERLARLRLTNNQEINIQRIKDFKKSISRKDINDNDKLEEFVKGFESIAKELALPVEEFIQKYAQNRDNNEFVVKFDECAKKKIVDELKAIKAIGLAISSDIIENLLRKTCFNESSKPGFLHLCSIESAMTSLKDNLYVCGLSSNYPGSPKENPLLLDSDLALFNNETLTSDAKVKRKIKTLEDLVILASSLNNKIYLSYPGLNVSELKNNNASSCLFSIYKLEKKKDCSLAEFKKEIRNIAYFEPKLTKNSLVGEAYNTAKEISYQAVESKNEETVTLDIDRYSPSALNTFFNCKKAFFYQYLLKIKAPDDYDPYEVLPSTEQGTLAHALMEYLAEHKMSKDEFIKLTNEVFDEYTKISVPLSIEKIDDAKEQFVEMLANGWQMDNDYPGKLFLKEEDKDAVHDDTGIIIHGYPDRVELNSEGKAVIIDFKTERDKDAHLQDDVDTCLQVLIYAYIVEKTCQIKVDHCEYRMLRYPDGIITCKYDEKMKAALNDKLQEFKKALESGNFSIEKMSKEEEKIKCKYCKYGSICGKEVSDD